MDMAIDSPQSNGDDTSAASSAAAAAAAQSMKLTNLADSLKLEHQFLRVPLEHYKKTIRTNHRIAEKEVSAVLSSVSAAADRCEDMSREDSVTHLTSLVSGLQGLKRKLEEGSKAETLQAQRCRARLDHLESANADNLNEWNDTRLKRILVDYMLRMSYYDSAIKLAESSNIQDLVDLDVFLEAKKIIETLHNKQVAPSLAWCAENRSRLKKAKSKFEFQLRLQEFIELVRADNSIMAVEYARKYLAPWGATYMKELQRVMATLAFRSNTECETYKVEDDLLNFKGKKSRGAQNFFSVKEDLRLVHGVAPIPEVQPDQGVLFEAKQWDYLVEQFKQEFCRLFVMTLEPLLNIYLQAGLSALKTPFCYEEDCPKADPLSQEGFRRLAAQLPFSKQHHSKLVCYITKELMDSENPPLVLPNGYVYSAKALEEMAKKNDGKVTCPRTGEVCNYAELVKAFIS